MEKVVQVGFIGLKILTTSRKNMKNPPQYTEQEKGLLSKRGLIETVNDQLKNIHQIEHSRHRSVNNFMVNLMAAIIAYCLKPNKPTLKNLVNASIGLSNSRYFSISKIRLIS